MLLEPAGEGADEVLSAEFSLPVLGLAAGGAAPSGVVRRFLESDFGHGEGLDAWAKRKRWIKLV